MYVEIKKWFLNLKLLWLMLNIWVLSPAESPGKDSGD